jgi:hypothetical protein
MLVYTTITVERLVVTVVRGEAAQAADDLDRETVGTVGARVSHKRHVLATSVPLAATPVLYVMVWGCLVRLAKNSSALVNSSCTGRCVAMARWAAMSSISISCLAPKPPPIRRLDYADVLDLHVDERCQHPAGVERNLRRGPDDHAFV